MSSVSSSEIEDTSKNSLHKVKDLRSILMFTIPSIILMAFTSTYSMVDGFFVSNYIGTDALSATNIVSPIYFAILGAGTMIAAGGVALVGKKMGEGKLKEGRNNFSLIVLFGFILGVIALIIGYTFMEQLVTFLGADETIFDYCMDYGRTLIFFAPILIIQLMSLYFLIVSGRPGISLIATLCGGFINIALDYLLIAEMGMGVTGAALATGLGLLAPCIIGLFYFGIHRKGPLYFVRPKYDRHVLLKTCTNGSSEMMTYIAIAVTTTLFNLSMMYYLGVDGVAAITIILYAEFVANAIIIGYVMGIGPVMAFYYGEGNKKRMNLLYKSSIKIVIICSIIVFIILQLFSPYIVSAFAERGTDVFILANIGLRIFSFTFLFSGLNIYASGLFTSLSNGKISALIAFIRGLLLLSPMIILLPLLFDSSSIWYAVPITEALTVLISLYFIKRKRKEYGY